MCGIYGIYNINVNKHIDNKLFEESLLTMLHRGPDAHQIKSFGNNAILGHLRLSIIDLSEQSNQPFMVDNRYWIVFNGEIFNYIELKDELIFLGYSFNTSSDTEVLLRSYEHWGEDCVTHFNGMWAFAIYDQNKNELFCSRDRFGIKPFNYSFINGQFVFSSEIKAIINFYPELKKPNYNVISNYCRTGIGAQIKETWFEGIYRLEPANSLKITAEGITKKRYWDYPRKINKKISNNEAETKYKDILKNSVDIRMRSDVPVGFTLSSGIDSSSLVCLLKNQFYGNKYTFTAGFDQTEYNVFEKDNFKSNIEINEPAIVRKLTGELNLVPDIIEIDYSNYINELEGLIRNLESGHNSPAIYPLNKILREAKKFVTVVVEGQGADELLGGYISNVMPVYLLELITKFKFKKAFFELKTFSKTYSFRKAFMLFIRQSNLNSVKRMYFRISGLESYFTGKLKAYKGIKDYPITPKGFNNKLNKHLYKAHTGGLVNLLHYGDAISMKHSLESRLPFMDYRLVEFVFTLPSKYKVDLGMGKIIHRQSMKDIVPDYILNNPYKFGFESPLSNIYSGDTGKEIEAILISERSLNRNLFTKDRILKAFDEQRKGIKNNSRVLFRLLSVELWFRLFIDK